MEQFDAVRKSLEQRGFTVSCFATKEEAAEYLNGAIDGTTVGFGGSGTLDAMGLYDSLGSHNTVYWHWKQDEAARAAAAGTEVYLCSANAIAETGEIVNIDGTCNRIAGSLYGFDACYVVCGVNKLTPDLTSAMRRARTIAAPLNASRLGKRTPCAVDGKCHDCRSPERICRAMAVLMAPPARMRHYEIVLIGEELGY